jgi:hypothetical protein
MFDRTSSPGPRDGEVGCVSLCFPTVDAAMKQPRPTPRAVGIATTAAYASAILPLRGRNDSGPACTVIATFRADPESLPANAPRRNVLHRLSTQLDAMVAQHEGTQSRAITAAGAGSHRAEQHVTATEHHFTYELLGDHLLAAGRKAEAADAYQKALESLAAQTRAGIGASIARYSPALSGNRPSPGLRVLADVRLEIIVDLANSSCSTNQLHRLKRHSGNERGTVHFSRCVIPDRLTIGRQTLNRTPHADTWRTFSRSRRRRRSRRARASA